MCTTTRLAILSVFLAALTAGFLALGCFTPQLIHSVLVSGLQEQRVITSPNSTGFAQWNSSEYPDSPPQYFSVFLWNVTNPEEAKRGENPKLDQIGPFVYLYHYHHFDLSWSEDGDFLTNVKFENYIFLPEKSIGDPKSINVTVINVPYVAVRSGIPESDRWWSAMVFDLITTTAHADIFVTQDAHSAVWGSNSSFLQWLRDTIQPDTDPFFQIQFNDSTEEGCRQRLKHAKDIFNTGKSNFSNVLQYKQWHNMTDLKVWNGTRANKVFGTDGANFPTEMPEGVNFTVFVDTLFRHVEFWSNTSINVQGIPARRYWLDPKSFWNHSQGSYEYSLYLPEGLTNMTGPESAQLGQAVPIFLCLPLFFMSDPSYRENITFLPPHDKPIREIHNTELDVEPITGLTIAANKRVQVNVQVKPTFMLYPKFKHNIFPLVWFQLSSELTPALADQWKSQVGLAVFLIANGGSIVFGVAAFFGLLFILTSFWAYRKRNTHDYTLVDNNDEYPSPANSINP